MNVPKNGANFDFTLLNSDSKHDLDKVTKCKIGGCTIFWYIHVLYTR